MKSTLLGLCARLSATTRVLARGFVRARGRAQPRLLVVFRCAGLLVFRSPRSRGRRALHCALYKNFSMRSLCASADLVQRRVSPAFAASASRLRLQASLSVL
eukprot:6198171-Pleurochrysis_carterae.AAC.1